MRSRDYKMWTSRLDCCVSNSTRLTRGQAKKRNLDLSMKSKNISRRCLILRPCTTCPLENARVHLQCSFSIELHIRLGYGRWPKKKIRTCLVLRKSSRDRRFRCRIRQANSANKNLTSIACIFVCYPLES